MAEGLTLGIIVGAALLDSINPCVFGVLIFLIAFMTKMYKKPRQMLFGGLFASYIVLRVGGVDWPQGRDYLNIPIGTFNTAVLIISSVTIVMSWASLKMRNFKKYKFYMGMTLLCGLTFLLVKSYEYNEKFTHYGVILNDGTMIKGHLEQIERDADGKLIALSLLPDAKHGEDHPPVQTITADRIKRWSNFTPQFSTFFAIYFTLTGLHALHVFGGMIMNSFLFGRATCTILSILGMGGVYTVFFGSMRETLSQGFGFMKFGAGCLLIGLPILFIWIAVVIWRKNNSEDLMRNQTERFTNRVEVSGLFWHFVDLVWIFLFPVLYLL